MIFWPVGTTDIDLGGVLLHPTYVSVDPGLQTLSTCGADTSFANAPSKTPLRTDSSSENGFGDPSSSYEARVIDAPVRAPTQARTGLGRLLLASRRISFPYWAATL